MFNPQQAHGLLNNIMENRRARQGKTLKYKLHYGHNLDQIKESVSGYTIKELMEEFRKSGGAYRHAFITNLSGSKVYRGFDRKQSRKWVSFTRSKK